MRKKPLINFSDKTRMATKADGTKLPVLDGKFSFLIEPNDDDVKNGIPGDPTQCMYCLCCKRQYGSELVWVTRTRAYVELRGPKGRLELRRFVLTPPAMIEVKGFDQGRDVSREAVIFAAPHGKERLDVIRSKYQESKKAQVGKPNKPKKAFVKGKNAKKVHKPHEVDSFRTLRAAGTGMFQFPRKEKE